MGHTYTQLVFHGVFSTKHRKPLLNADILPELAKVVGGIVRERDGKLLALNGTENHIHLLSIFHPSYCLADMFRDVKAISTNWIHEKFRDMNDFAWQSGYGAFSVSKSNLSSVQNYIDTQKEHHAEMSFESELIALLEKHGIEYDKRYIFD